MLCFIFSIKKIIFLIFLNSKFKKIKKREKFAQKCENEK